MNSSDPTKDQFAAYRAMWAYFNKVLFAGALSHVILNFSRHARALGFFAPERWRNVGDEVTHEISLNPSYLKRTDMKDAVSTLVHEMAHLWRYEQWRAEVRNTPPGQVKPKPPTGGYHDVRWADKMESIGLMPSDTGKPGGNRVGYRMDHYIIPDGEFDRAFESMPVEAQLPWTCGVDEDALKGKKGKEAKAKAKAEAKEAERKRKLKYSCPKCELNVWGKPGLNLSCNDCDEELRVEGQPARTVTLAKAA
jgi:predicted SprT family Zn-dependent metalloprotease